ncbi:MAG: choice-of-anchor P family protein [bacterium]
MDRSLPVRLVLTLVVLLSAAAQTTALADVKGRAYAVYANLPSYGLNAVTYGNTGRLDPVRGGRLTSQRAGISHGTALRVDFVESESSGDRCRGVSRSKLASGWILKGTPYEVTWVHMESADDDTCCRAYDKDMLPSSFAGLTFAGRPVIVTGRPNQTVSVPGAMLILNESKRGSSYHGDDDEDEDEVDDDCDDDDYEHRALRLVLANGATVILGAAKFDSDDDCCMVTPVRHSTWGAVKSHYR